MMVRTSRAVDLVANSVLAFCSRDADLGKPVLTQLADRLHRRLGCCWRWSTEFATRSTARGARTIMARKWGACVAGWRAALHLRPDGRIEADGHWMFQLRSADRSTLFSGIM